MSKKKLYYKMYEDRKSTRYQSCVIPEKDLETNINGFFEYGDEDSLPPVFEPVWMTQEEYDALPEFKGF